MIEIDRLRELLSYNPDTGELSWIRKDAGRRSKCGSLSKGYLRIKVDGKSYLGHVIAWALMTGEWPDHEIDHRNRTKLDNRWVNFRAATRLQNCNNRSLSKNNPSGTNGVTYHKGMKRWRVRLRGKHYGTFISKDQACEVAASHTEVW